MSEHSGAGFWPLGGASARDAMALVLIDMQVDFRAHGGWIDQLGEDVSNTRAVIAPIGQALDAARAAGSPRSAYRHSCKEGKPNGF